jgi:hypothetical protein
VLTQLDSHPKIFNILLMDVRNWGNMTSKEDNEWQWNGGLTLMVHWIIPLECGYKISHEV